MLVNASARTAVEIDTATDTDGNFYALYVGVSGDIVVDTVGGQLSVTFTNVPVGWFPVQITRVHSAGDGTTADGLVGLAW